jgi:4-diphosphocytidyl-2C-methyl-D-erythritol kinase
VPSKLNIAAHAKINLALAVGPPAPPHGYHPICSWMSAIDVFDDVEIERLEDRLISQYAVEWAPNAARPTPIDWPIEKDLAVRAHQYVEQIAGRPLPVKLTVRKRIPVGGGLGGGSADAGAVLTGLVHLFDDLDLPMEHIAEVSTALGSDVGFFTQPGLKVHGLPQPAIVEGFGETIERLDRFERPLILFVPEFGTSTGAVYKALDAKPNGELKSSLVRELAGKGAQVDTMDLFNDLAEPACRVEPRLGELRAHLTRALEVPVHITGSGSSLFCLSDGRLERAKLLKRAREAAPGLVTISGTTI